MIHVCSPPWICGWNRKPASQIHAVHYNAFSKRHPTAVLPQAPQPCCKGITVTDGNKDGCSWLAPPETSARSGSCGTAGNFLSILCCPVSLLRIILLLLWILTWREGGGGRSCALFVLFPSLPCRQYTAVLKEGLGSLLFSQAFFLSIKRGKTTKSLFGSAWLRCGLTLM